MKKRKSCLRLIACAALLSLCTFGVAQAQVAESPLEISVKAKGSLLAFQNHAISGFNYASSNALGAHLSLSKSFGNWGIETGIGIERMRFSQETTTLFDSDALGTVGIAMNYFAIQIPLYGYVDLSESLRASGGFNLMAANLNAYSVSTTSNALGSSGFESFSNSGFPGFQFVAEAQVGMSKQISPKFAVGAHFATSLWRLKGIDQTFVSHTEHVRQNEFEYSWMRFGLDVAYRLK
jgi:hypothetical protein